MTVFKIQEEDYNYLLKKIERYEEALTKIATRKMSMYVDKDHMLRNFIYLADNALNGEEG